MILNIFELFFQFCFVYFSFFYYFLFVNIYQIFILFKVLWSEKRNIKMNKILIEYIIYKMDCRSDYLNFRQKEGEESVIVIQRIVSIIIQLKIRMQTIIIKIKVLVLLVSVFLVVQWGRIIICIIKIVGFFWNYYFLRKIIVERKGLFFIYFYEK